MRQKVVNTKFMTKCIRYYKVRWVLQSMTDCYYIVRQALQSVTDCYYKVFQSLKNATIIRK